MNFCIHQFSFGKSYFTALYTFYLLKWSIAVSFTCYSGNLCTPLYSAGKLLFTTNHCDGNPNIRCSVSILSLPLCDHLCLEGKLLHCFQHQRCVINAIPLFTICHFVNLCIHLCSEGKLLPVQKCAINDITFSIIFFIDLRTLMYMFSQ